jgi:hypothetical protein
MHRFTSGTCCVALACFMVTPEASAQLAAGGDAQIRSIIEPRRSTPIGDPVQGVTSIERIVADGSEVTAGEVICVLNSTRQR